MGALDITSQTYDANSRVLRVGLAPAGKRNRRVYVAHAGLAPLGAALDGADVPLLVAGAVCSIDVTVDAPCTLEVRFGRA